MENRLNITFIFSASELRIRHHYNGNILDNRIVFARCDLIAPSAVISNTWCAQSERDQSALFQRYKCSVCGWNDACRSCRAVESAQENCAENIASDWDEA